MTLVARCCHNSLAPPPLPLKLLAERRSVPCLVATGRHDVFLPPQRVGPAAQRHLGTRLHVMDDSGHLLLDESPGEVVALVARAMDSALGDAALTGRSRPIRGGQPSSTGPAVSSAAPTWSDRLTATSRDCKGGGTAPGSGWSMNLPR